MPYNATGLKVNFPHLKPVDYLCNIPRYPFNDNGNIGYHLLPQSYFIPPNISFIGKLENLQKDFNAICANRGMPQQKLSHERKTSHKPYREYYDKEAKQLVAQKYAKDIEYFGYKF